MSHTQDDHEQEAASSHGLFSKTDFVGGLVRILPSFTDLALGYKRFVPMEGMIAKLSILRLIDETTTLALCLYPKKKVTAI
ncbi:hypothetical protein PG993_011696 [Apiospora rasikravindrae]|uniref:Uncharacterized protein n=1 Tax=Apiospora rasikravindrae TaxID=990691 RepID=A0ABR1S1T3_9PEZI